MALEAVIYSLDPFSGYGANYNKEQQYYGLLLDDYSNTSPNGTTSCWDSPNIQQQLYHSSSPDPCSHTTTTDHHQQHQQHQEFYPGEMVDGDPPSSSRRKRRRTKSSKNKEEIESQRMTHIAVERNRRKQMNDYLALLRSLMPPSYVQRGDQASIIGGAINFVKELEQILQAAEANRKTSHQQDDGERPPSNNVRQLPSSPVFSDFFSFPQYSTRAQTHTYSPEVVVEVAESSLAAAVGDIEVTMVESHANIKILAKKQPSQLLKLVAQMQTLRLTILHLNVTTTAHQMVLYSLSIKLEEGCHLNTVDEIAAAVNEMLRRIQEEAAFT